MLCVWTACKTQNIDIDSCGFTKNWHRLLISPSWKSELACLKCQLGEKKRLTVNSWIYKSCSLRIILASALFSECDHSFLTIAWSKNYIGKFAYTYCCKDSARHWDATNTIPKFRALRQQGTALGFSYKQLAKLKWMSGRILAQIALHHMYLHVAFC